MKLILLIFALLYSASMIQGQNGGGFSRLYALGENPNYGSHFSNVILRGDTIVAYGNAYTNESVPFIGLVLAKFDTFGNLLDRRFCHLPNDDMITEEGNNLLCRKDGGYASISTTFTGHQAAMTIFDEIGEPISNHLNGVNGIFTLFARRIIEMQDGGFLIGGFVSKLDYSLENFVKRIGISGNQLWSRGYGKSGQDDLMQSLIKIDDNTFVIGGDKHAPQGTPLPSFWANNWIFAIDSMGVIKWQWFGPTNEEIAVIGLHATTNGGWIYGSYSYEIVSPEEWESKCKVVKRDSNFNLLWERILSPAGSYANRISDLAPTPDGNWVVSGTWAYRTGPGIDDLIFYNCLYKLNDQGDTLWGLRLKAPLGYEGVSYPGGFTVLPSGSVVWALRYDRYEPPPAQSFGWLVKVDNEGCVDTLCQLSGPSSEPLGEIAAEGLRVYPNPAQNEVTFDLPEGSPPALLKVFDPSGRLIWMSEFQGKNVWQTTGCPPGLYFYTLSMDGQIAQYGKVAVVR